MATGTYQPTVSIGGQSTRQSITKTGDHTNNYVKINLPVATEVLTYENDEDDTASGTLSPGHGLASGNFDMYWATGVRYDVAFVITDDDWATDTSGAGDALPIDSTAVNISAPIEINTAIDGDAIKLISLNSSLRSHIMFLDVSAATIYATELIGNEPQVWHDTGGLANVYTGNPITSAFASNGETSGAATLDILCLEDSTP